MPSAKFLAPLQATRHATMPQPTYKMKNIVIALLVSFCSSYVWADESQCVSIKQDKLRLACYDKASKATAATTDVATTGRPATPQKFHSGPWFVNESIDAMTDKRTCTALDKNAWTIQGVPSNLYVSLKGRGGVRAYKLRFDDEPADSMQLANDTEKEISVVILGYNFDRVAKAKRLRMEISTLVSGVIVEDIDLNGFNDAVSYMKEHCES